MESDPDPLVKGADPDPHQNVTDPLHWLKYFRGMQNVTSVLMCSKQREKGINCYQVKSFTLYILQIIVWRSPVKYFKSHYGFSCNLFNTRTVTEFGFAVRRANL
jgi:hypothetical protein